jgi:hypothetical protein
MVAHADSGDPFADRICKAVYTLGFDDTVAALTTKANGHPMGLEQARWTVALAIAKSCPSQVGQIPADIQDDLLRR